MQLALGPWPGADLAERGGVLAEVERDAVEPGADPHDLAGRAERVELLRPVAGDAPGQQVALPEAERQRQRLQRHERLAQRRAPADALPRGKEARERRRLDRLDLSAKRREGRSPQPAEDVGIAPLALAAPGTELAADEQLLTIELLEDVGHVAAEAVVGLRRGERAAALREAKDQLT